MRSLTELGKAVLSGLRDALDLARQTATLGLLSLGLAIVVWFIVSDAQNPPKTGSFSGMIPIQAINVPSGKAPTSLAETAQITLKLTADQDVWDDLSVDDFTAKVDLSGMTQAEASLPLLVETSRNDVRIVQVNSPSSVDVSLEPVITASRPVKINTVAVAPSGFNVTSESVSPETVQVSGAQSLVEQTDAAWVDLNLTGTQISFDRDFILNARDKDGRPVDVRVEPKTAKVSVNIVRTDWVLTFPVNPSITGSVAAGYWAKAVEVDRPFVNVRGPVDVLQSISVITTDTIPVDGAQSNVKRNVKLHVPEGATVDGGNEVVVSVRIEPASGQRNYDVAVQTSGLKDGLVANFAAQNVTVTVAGQLPVLDALAADAIVVRLDLSNLDPGSYQISPKIEVPADVQLVGVSPSDIQVTVSPR